MQFKISTLLYFTVPKIEPRWGEWNGGKNVFTGYDG